MTDMFSTLSGRPHQSASKLAHFSRLAMHIMIFALLAVALSACNDSSVAAPNGAAIAFDALPAGMGRGFPAVSLAGINNDETGLESGERAPNFTLLLEEGGHISLSDLEGRPVMLNFWATWCPPCREEMPDIIEAYEADDELVVLSVNVREEMGAVAPFTEDFQISMPVLMDRDGELAELYAVRGMPTSVFIDRDGMVVTKWPGILSGDALGAMLNMIP